MTGQGARDREVGAARDALLGTSASALLAMLIIAPLLRFDVDLISFHPAVMLASLPVLFLPYARWRGITGLIAAIETTALGLLLTVPLLTFSYGAMRLGLPLVDDRLRAWDAALGFDWVACVRLIDRFPSLAAALSVGYGSFAFQLLFLPALLCAVRLPARAYRLILGYLVLCTVSVIVAAAFPAHAAYVAYGLDPDTLRHVDGHFGRLFLESFDAARAPGPFTLTMGNAAGIVTFPSGHAGIAALCAWATWPSRPLRALFLPLNILMAASAITNGGHYLVDLLAAGVVAAVTVTLVHRIELRFHAWRQTPARSTAGAGGLTQIA